MIISNSLALARGLIPLCHVSSGFARSPSVCPFSSVRCCCQHLRPVRATTTTPTLPSTPRELCFLCDMYRIVCLSRSIDLVISFVLFACTYALCATMRSLLGKISCTRRHNLNDKLCQRSKGVRTIRTACTCTITSHIPSMKSTINYCHST